MPARIRIESIFEEQVNGFSAEQMMATACSIFEDVDDGGHRASIKPFCSRRIHLNGRSVAFEYGVLDDDAIHDVIGRIESRDGTIRLGRRMGKATGLEVVEHHDWDELVSMTMPARFIRVAFESPTFFRRGDRFNLLPNPSSVFGHWRKRWEVFHGIAPHCDFHDLEIDVTRIELKSVDLSYRRQNIRGIVGEVTYDLSRLDEEERHAMAAFALLAPFAGCGTRTTAGFGACRTEIR
jgi:CRISPR-associated endoribonuclease Cas6